MRRAVVTGAAGFLGSHFVDALLADGWHVIGLDNLSTGRLRNLHSVMEHPRFEWREHDVVRDDAFGWLPSPVSLVAHFASPASPVDYQQLPKETMLAGSAGTLHCLEFAARRQAVFLLASTSEVYGDPLRVPQTEDYRGNVSPTGPRSMYDEAKRYAEALTQVYHREGVQTRIVRIFNTYGPRMRPEDGRLIPTLIRQAFAREPFTIHGSGVQTRSFCYVSDMIAGLMCAVDLWDLDGPVNLGGETDIPVIDVAQIVAAAAGVTYRVKNVPRPPDDPTVRRPSLVRAQKLMGWKPEVNLQLGIRKMIDAWESDEC